jgi:hypothetical protein
LRILDDHAEFYRYFNRPGFAGVVRVASQHVRTVTIIHRSDPRNYNPQNPVAPLRRRCSRMAVVMGSAVK